MDPQAAARLQRLWPAARHLPEPLHAEYLLRGILHDAFRDAESPAAFAPYFEETLLSAWFAESKLRHGIGPTERWRADLPDDRFTELFERRELYFADFQQEFFFRGEPVKVRLNVKGKPEVTVRIYRINPIQELPQGLRTPLPLSGYRPELVRTFAFPETPFLQHAQTLEFPELSSGGHFVLDVQAGELSARALIQVGNLTPRLTPGPPRPMLRVLDERGRTVRDSSVRIDGVRYDADETGLIPLPYFDENEKRAFLTGDGLTQPVTLTGLAAELEFLPYQQRTPHNYDISGIGDLALHLSARVNGRVLPTDAIRDVRVTSYTRFARDRMVHQLVSLRGRNDLLNFLPIRNNLSLITDQFFEAEVDPGDGRPRWVKTPGDHDTHHGEETIYNIIHADEQGWHLFPDPERQRQTDGETIQMRLYHQAFGPPRGLSFPLDEDGPVRLGPLPGIQRFSLPRDHLYKMSLTPFDINWPEELELNAGEALRLPYGRTFFGIDPPEALLFALTPEGVILADVSEHVQMEQGACQLAGLPPGRYLLTLVDAVGTTLRIRVSAGHEAAPDAEVPGYDPPRLAEIRYDGEDMVLQFAGNTGDLALVLHLSPAYTPMSYQQAELIRPDDPPLMNRPAAAPPAAIFLNEFPREGEARYVWERQRQEHFSGSLLPRPSLLLNPFDLRITETPWEPFPDPPGLEVKDDLSQLERKLDEVSRELGVHSERISRLQGRLAGSDNQGQWSSGEVFPSYVFPHLATPDRWVSDVAVDAEGRARIPGTFLEGQAYLTVLARQGTTSFRQVLHLSDDPPSLRSRRVQEIPDPDQVHVVRHTVTQVDAEAVVEPDNGDERTVDDLRGGWEMLRGFAEASEHTAFQLFTFLPHWTEYEEADKLKWLEAFASHELHLFLHARDPDFFARVVRPRLQNRSSKTLVDRWLLDDLSDEDKDPAAFPNRNALELTLLAKSGVETAAIHALLEDMEADPLSAHELEQRAKEVFQGQLFLNPSHTAPEFAAPEFFHDPRHPGGNPQVRFTVPRFSPPDPEKHAFLQTLTPEELDRYQSLSFDLETRRQELIRAEERTALLEGRVDLSHIQAQQGRKVIRVPDDPQFTPQSRPRVERGYFQHADGRHPRLPRLADVRRGGRPDLEIERFLEETPAPDVVLTLATFPEVLERVQAYLDLHPHPAARALRLEVDPEVDRFPPQSVNLQGLSLAEMFSELAMIYQLQLQIRTAEGDAVRVSTVPRHPGREYRHFPAPEIPAGDLPLDELVMLMNARLSEEWVNTYNTAPPRFVLRHLQQEYAEDPFENLFGGPDAAAMPMPIFSADEILIADFRDLLQAIEEQTGFHAHPRERNRIHLRPFPPSRRGPQTSVSPFSPGAEPRPVRRVSPMWRRTASGDMTLSGLLELQGGFTESVLALAWGNLPFNAPEPEAVPGAPGRVRTRTPQLRFRKALASYPVPLTADGELFFFESVEIRTPNGWRRLPVEDGQIQVSAHTTIRLNANLQNMTDAERNVSLSSLPPEGAIHLMWDRSPTETRSLPRHARFEMTRSFYFPEPGRYERPPTLYLAEGRPQGAGRRITFNVTPFDPDEHLSPAQRQARSGSAEDRIKFLSENQITPENWMPFHQHLLDNGFYQQAMDVLRRRQTAPEWLLPFAVAQRDAEGVAFLLTQSQLAGQVGPYFQSPLLSVSTSSDWLEWAPLHPARAHGPASVPPSIRLAYGRFLRDRMWRTGPDEKDLLHLAWFMAQHNRLREAEQLLRELPEPFPGLEPQSAYLRAWLATRLNDPEAALALSRPYLQDDTSRLWRERFQAVHDAVMAAEGAGDAAAEPLGREEPEFHLQIEDGNIFAHSQTTGPATLRLYPVQIEMQFSLDPFGMVRVPRAPLVLPAREEEHLLSKEAPTRIDLQEDFRTESLIVELVSGNRVDRILYAPDRLSIRLLRDQGQVWVRDADTGDPLPLTYVKVFAMNRLGSVLFWKDGYTDARGRFDYLTHHAPVPEAGARFALLIHHPDKGTRTLETAPPLR